MRLTYGACTPSPPTESQPFPPPLSLSSLSLSSPLQPSTLLSKSRLSTTHATPNPPPLSHYFPFPPFPPPPPSPYLVPSYFEFQRTFIVSYLGQDSLFSDLFPLLVLLHCVTPFLPNRSRSVTLCRHHLYLHPQICILPPFGISVPSLCGMSRSYITTIRLDPPLLTFDRVVVNLCCQTLPVFASYRGIQQPVLWLTVLPGSLFFFLLPCGWFLFSCFRPGFFLGWTPLVTALHFLNDRAFPLLLLVLTSFSFPSRGLPCFICVVQRLLSVSPFCIFLLRAFESSPFFCFSCLIRTQ